MKRAVETEQLWRSWLDSWTAATIELEIQCSYLPMRLQQIGDRLLAYEHGRKRKQDSPLTLQNNRPLILAVMRAELPFECSPSICLDPDAQALWSSECPENTPVLASPLSSTCRIDSPSISDSWHCLLWLGLYFSTLTHSCLILAQEDSHPVFYSSSY